MSEVILSNKQVFNFNCQMTGNCCNKMEIYLNPYDILQIATSLNTTTTEIINKHLIFLENKQQGLQKPIFYKARTTYCDFNKDKKCQIHKKRPLSCRLFPLIRKNGKFYNSNSSFCQGLSSMNQQNIDSYLVEQEALEYIAEADVYHKLLTLVVEKYDLKNIDQYLLQLFYLVLFDYDQVFYEYEIADNKEKNRFAIHIAEFLVENYFNNINYDKEDLLNKIFVEGDRYLAESIKK
ncbi:MAG: YkgJ family cysteine cluster protein [Fusobacteria bacterium]|nr:YkgJ family cysteine cluster protein [Fusobacteriota bacterium]